jgi:hypothetical protein
MKRANEQQQRHTIKGGKHRDAGMRARVWGANRQRPKEGWRIRLQNQLFQRPGERGMAVEGAEEK